ncbi:MAG: peptide chain release factor N(5)-glutamine methyltransferase [Leptospiraceae bacterium]|nr:peptide chain release factor N(5)-glutamine methyltransferase [Leptospiraceae bacterium]
MTEINIDTLLGPAEAELAAAGIENYFMESRWLLGAVLRIHSSILFAHPDLEITPARQEQFRRWVRERAGGKPLAYITGDAPFYELDFFVDPAVLIPRPETEELVELCLARMPDQGLLLDLGCGSGCIGISLVHQKPQWHLHLLDISEAALIVARKNKSRHLAGNPNVFFHQGDFFTALPQELQFDMIVSNPPYIHPDEEASLDASVLDYEPHEALFHPDPVRLYADLIQTAATRLRPQGHLAMELAPRWSAAVLDAARQHFAEAHIEKDMSDKDRMLIARLA